MRTPCCIIAALCCIGVACSSPSPESDTAGASAFVQHFYDWYAPILLKGGDTVPDLVALNTHPTWFDSSLAAALRADNQASAKVPDEVAGLDYDPFTASQDPCEKYVVDRAERRDSHVVVALYGVCAGKRDSIPSVSAEVVRRGSEWVFTNFYFPHSPGSDLASDLKALAADRARAATSPDRRVPSKVERPRRKT